MGDTVNVISLFMCSTMDGGRRWGPAHPSRGTGERRGRRRRERGRKGGGGDEKKKEREMERASKLLIQAFSAHTSHQGSKSILQIGLFLNKVTNDNGMGGRGGPSGEGEAEYEMKGGICERCNGRETEGGGWGMSHC